MPAPQDAHGQGARRRLRGFALTGCLVAATSGGAFAQPPHRAARKSQPAPVSRTAPDVTATIPPRKTQTGADRAGADRTGENQTNEGRTGTAQPAKPPALQTRDLGETIPKPFDLPSASRPRMRACGEKWQALKLAGQAGSDTWRDFATKCLAER